MRSSSSSSFSLGGRGVGWPYAEGALVEIRLLNDGFHFDFWYNWSETLMGKGFTSVFFFNWSEKFMGKGFHFSF
jgi:hypothetical protein